MRSILKLPVVCLGFLLSAACAHAGAGTGIPDAILNQGTAQNAQMNVGTATVRGTLTTSTLAVTAVQFSKDGTVFTSTAGLGGGGAGGIVSLSTGVTGNLGLSHLNSGTGASSLKAFFGDSITGGAWRNGPISPTTTQVGDSIQWDMISSHTFNGLADNHTIARFSGEVTGANGGSGGLYGNAEIWASEANGPTTVPVASFVADNSTGTLGSAHMDQMIFGRTAAFSDGTNHTHNVQASWVADSSTASFIYGTLYGTDRVHWDKSIEAPLFLGSGASLTGITATTVGLSNVQNVDQTNASNLSIGTVPDGRFPATLPAVSGAALTSLNASNLSAGTVPDARFPATLPAASGVNLTALNASNLTSGTLPAARTPALGGAITMAAGSTTTVLNTLISPSTGIAAGVLASNVVASSVAVAAVGDAQITGMAASKLTGTITSAQLPALTGAITSSAGSNVTSFNGLISPSTGIAAGTLASNVIASSVAVAAVGDAQISAVAGSKVSGNITGSAANVTGTVAVANGGTGLTTITTGQLFIGNGAGSVAAGFLTAGTNVQITTGIGSITIAASTAGAGPFTGAVSSTSISMNSFAINSVSTNSWTNATINGATTYWAPPPTTSTSTFFPMFTGTQVSYPQVMTGVNQNTSSNTISGYRVFQSTVVLPTSAAPTVDQAGAIGFDTTDKQYIGHNGTEQFVIGHATQVATVFIASGTGSGSGFDSMTIPFFEVSPDQPILIRSIDSAAMGGTSVTFNIEKRANTSLSSAGVNATGSAIVATTGVTHTSAFSSASAAKSAWLVLTTSSSAGSGAVTGLVVTINYTDTVE